MKYIYIDGGCRNNQNAAKREAYGSFLITEDEYPNHEKSKVLVKRMEFGNLTNNAAEYKTLHEVLKHCINEFIAKPVIFTDSLLVTNQLNGTYKVKDPNLRKLNDLVKMDLALIGAELRKVPRDILVGVLGH